MLEELGDSQTERNPAVEKKKESLDYYSLSIEIRSLTGNPPILLVKGERFSSGQGESQTPSNKDIINNVTRV